MKATDLLRFILENEIEYRWEEEDVIIWLGIYNLSDFYQMLEANHGGIFDDGGIEAHLCSGGNIAFEMKHICEYFGIELEDVFKR